MADTKVSALTANTTPLGGDYLLQVDDPGGTPTSKRMTIGDVTIANSPAQGGLVNGYISRSVASNNLTVAIKTLAGGDPSSLDPVYVRIGNSVRTLTAALSVTINAGTDTFGLGAVGCLTDQDLFIYLGYRAAGSAVFIGVARINHGVTYADFSSTATAQTYLAYSGSAPASTDEVEVVGRVNVTTSGSASYNWSVPATSIVVSRPIFETRELAFTPVWTNITAGNATQTAKYKLIGRSMFVTVAFVFGSTSSVTGAPSFVTPISRATFGGSAGPWSGLVRLVDTGTAFYKGWVSITTTTAAIAVLNAGATYLSSTAISSTVPHTWTTLDEILIDDVTYSI